MLLTIIKTEIGVLPNDWKIMDLAELCVENGLIRGPFGGALTKSCFVPKGYKVYEQKNAIYKSQELGNYFINEAKFKELKRFEVKAGDFILSCSGTIGKFFQIPKSHYKGVINQALLIIRLNTLHIHPDYFNHIFGYDLIQRKIIDDTQGGAMKNLVGMSEFRKTKVPVPSPSEQQAIAEVLNETDAWIESLEAVLHKKRLIEQGMVQELLQPKKSWEVRTLGDVADKGKKWSFTGGPFGSNLKSSDYTSDGVRVIQLQNIGDGNFNDNSEIYTSFEKADELISCNIYPGDIILSKMGDPVARACIIPDNHPRYLMCSDGIRLVVNLKENNAYFIFRYINSSFFRTLAENNSTGSTRKRIGLVTLRNLELIVPNIDEQTHIAKILFDMSAEIDGLEKKLVRARQIKQGMLQHLLTGKIRLVKIANTEAMEIPKRVTA